MYVKTPADIGRLIREARMRARMSQTALASRFGTTQSWISEVETGKETAEIGKVLKMLSYLGLDLDLSHGPDHHLAGRSAPHDDRFPDISDIVGDTPRRP